ncbi:MAG: hypothetical protein FNP40_02535 [Dehalobacter sp. 4CP]|uniref:hypothetical protein n=1 Tax=Dehalobacter sp. CP TaxID=2594474 RepID=UPI0013C68FA4|nr:hypothetical protein [Dehalobacter sp.]NBJ14451.1 hypothetical protein [Dehalobacter sp. 4CP]
MKIILNPLNVVVAKGVDIRQVENGILCDGCVYIEQNLSISETDLEIAPFKNTLIDGVVGINPVWQASADGIKEQAIDEYTLSLIDGGII